MFFLGILLCPLLSLPSLHNHASLPSQEPAIPFSPKPCIHTFYLLWCGLFCPFNCAVFFCQSSCSFLRYIRWFDSYLVVFQGQDEPMVLLLNYHLPSTRMFLRFTHVICICNLLLLNCWPVFHFIKTIFFHFPLNVYLLVSTLELLWIKFLWPLL